MWVVKEMAVNKEYVGAISEDNGTLMVIWPTFYEISLKFYDVR